MDSALDVRRLRNLGVMTSPPSPRRHSRSTSPERLPGAVRLEVCVETTGGALTALRAGADRVELCSGLAEGGLTPSAGLVATTLEALTEHDGSVGDVRVLVRPRAGDFVYDALELDAMRRDVDLVRTSGARGVVIGVLTPDGDVDVTRTAELVARARPLEVTFHRALDMTRDRRRALETLIELGVDAVLTSGGRTSVTEGVDGVRELVEASAGRIEVIAGGGVRAESIARIVESTGVGIVHASARSARPSRMQHRNLDCRMTSVPPPDEYERLETDEAVVRRFLAELGRPSPPAR